jgi:hypothetical protein
MRKIMVLLVVAAAVSAGFAQYRAVDRQAGMMIEGRPFFTDAARYNSYDMAGSPLGLFETGTPRFGVDAGYRSYRLGDESGHYLSVPVISMGQPGRTCTRLYYGPDIVSHKNNQNEVSLPLQRFGLIIATQATDAFFRTSILFDGYIGGQGWKNGDSSRAIMGVENLRLDLGSQLHPLVRIGFFVNFAGGIDTLHVPGMDSEQRSDRAGWVLLPEFGGNIDFGGEDIPVRSVLAVSYALSRFVYTSKPTGLPSIPQVDSLGNAHTVMNDSLRIAWLAQGEISVGGGYVLKPGLLFGISSNAGKMRIPHEENNPLQPGQVVPDAGYRLSGIYLGAGTGFQAREYAGLHIEYTAAMMSLNCESRDPQNYTKSRNLHHTSFGVSSQLHKYLDMPVNITPRVAYFISGSSRGVGAVHSSLDPLNIVPGKSKQAYYMPQLYLSNFERTSGFTFGIDGSGLDNMLSASFWMTFLSKNTVDRGGMEMGLSVGFSVYGSTD